MQAKNILNEGLHHESKESTPNEPIPIHKIYTEEYSNTIPG